MNNLKKLLASVMALAMVASVAPVKVDAAIAAPTVCKEETKYIETVTNYVEDLADVVDLETVKLDDEFEFKGETYATVEMVLAVESDWGHSTGKVVSLQEALDWLVESNCATDEVAYLAGLVEGVDTLENNWLFPSFGIPEEYENNFGEDGYFTTEAYWDDIEDVDDAKAFIEGWNALILKLTSEKESPALAYVGNTEDIADLIKEMVEGYEAAIDAVAEEYGIELANTYYSDLVEYLDGKGLIQIEQIVKPSGTTVTEISVVDINEIEWKVAGKRSGTTYDLEKLIETIEDDKAGLTGSYEDYENEVADLMDGLEDLLAASEELDELVGDVKDLAANTKLGKAGEAEAETITDKDYNKKTDTWADVFADATVDELFDDLNPAEFEYLAEMFELIEENFYSVSYTKKGSRWVTNEEYGPYYAHLTDVFGAAKVDLPNFDLLDNYYDEVKEEYTGETYLSVLADYMAQVEADVEAVTTGIKGITVNNLTSKNVEKVVAAKDALDRLEDAEGNLTAAEVKAVSANVENIGVLYIKALFNGDTTVKVTGWVDLGNGNWDYYGEDGNVFIGWVAAGSDWYYVKNGHMLRNSWIAKDATGAVWYYVGNDGAMVSNTVVDGYTINANGEWHA